LDCLKTVAIMGVGLIGGSIGWGLRSRGLAQQVVGLGRDPRRLAEAVERGLIDRGTTEPAAALAEAEVVVVCTPVDRIPGDVRRAAELSPAGVLVMDVGSTKRQIVEAVERGPAAGVFVGAHPLAGSELSGAAHARKDLFEDRVCVLTPTLRTTPDRLARAREFWANLGSRVLETTPAEHDEIVAFTSHLPHAVAAALAASVPPPWHPFTAGASRDGTRVARAETELWTAIFQENRGPLLRALGAFQDQLARFKYAIMTDDPAAIQAWWNEARRRRLAFESQATKGAPDG
jgi:prephenate dehydrogenase